MADDINLNDGPLQIPKDLPVCKGSDLPEGEFEDAPINEAHGEPLEGELPSGLFIL